MTTASLFSRKQLGRGKPKVTVVAFVTEEDQQYRQINTAAIELGEFVEPDFSGAWIGRQMCHPVSAGLAKGE